MKRNDIFEDKFQLLYTQMVEIAFEYVNRNREEIDDIYIIGSIEKGIYFTKIFYRINGCLVKAHKINTVSEMQYDVSKERAFSLLKKETDILKEVDKFFQSYEMETPTLLKLVYYPKSNKFSSKFEYGLKYTDHKSRTAQDIYEEWYIRIEQGNEI